jgi:hypothetical protein
VYPAASEVRPGEGEAPLRFVQTGQARPYSATHAAISMPAETNAVRRIAEREGWRALHATRGPFDVVELWLENRVLIEVLTPEMAADYRTWRIEAWEEPSR